MKLDINFIFIVLFGWIERNVIFSSISNRNDSLSIRNKVRHLMYN